MEETKIYADKCTEIICTGSYLDYGSSSHLLLSSVKGLHQHGGKGKLRISMFTVSNSPRAHGVLRIGCSETKHRSKAIGSGKGMLNSVVQEFSMLLLNYNKKIFG